MKINKIPILLLIPILLIGSTNAPVQTLSNNSSLNMTKLSTIATQTSPGCYSGYVAVNMTWTNSNATYAIIVQDFFIVISTPNQIISNSTIASYVSPSNTIQTVLLFPNIPITLRVSFQKVCGTPSTLRLIYLDGTFNFAFTLP